MKTSFQHLEDYLELRRRLGFKMIAADSELRAFVRHAQHAGASVVTTRLALEWATRPTGCQPVRWAARLRAVRLFARYLAAADPRTEVPPPGLLPYRSYRKGPYLYSDGEVVRLLREARRVPSPVGLRAATYCTLFGLLAATGMRVGEVIGLDRQDVDLNEGLLRIRHAKLNKSRLVPVAPSALTRLRRYQRLRDRIIPLPPSLAFLLSEQGTRLTKWAVRYWFIILSRQIGLRGPTDRRGPRIHDPRHRFAIKTLLDWYRTGKDVEVHLPELATYLGHAHLSDTYWYISATPELLELAAGRLEHQDQLP